MTMTSSPALGTSVRPWISTGIDGPASVIALPFSSSIARTRPKDEPASTTSPRFRVPDCTRMVATGPRPLSRRASTTRPRAGASTGAFSSSTSACSSTLFQQVVDALAGLGRHRHERRFAAVFFRHDAFGDQFLRHAVDVGARLVDLVDRHDQGHAGRFRVGDRFLGLRHHAVVRRHHQDDDVGRLGAAGTHGRERFVTRGIQEGDHAARRVDVVSADVLRDAAGFARRHLGAADVVQQRGLAVVDVTHDGHDRRARLGLELGRARPGRPAALPDRPRRRRRPCGPFPRPRSSRFPGPAPG